MDNTQYYGAVSRFFHWTMAVAFAFMLFTAIQFKQENYSWMARTKRQASCSPFWWRCA